MSVLSEKVETTLEAMRVLREQLDPLVRKATELVNEKQVALTKANGQHTGYGFPGVKPENLWNICDWKFDPDGGDSIEVHWSENWNYGGHDSGTFYHTLNFVLNEGGEHENYTKDMDAKIDEATGGFRRREREKAEREIAVAQRKLEGLK